MASRQSVMEEAGSTNGSTPGPSYLELGEAIGKALIEVRKP